ncbi:hypothetical protein ACSQ67_014636 [Phaseolus vulgaris]
MNCLHNLSRFVYPSPFQFFLFLSTSKESDSSIFRFSLLPFETVATRHRNNLPLSLAASGSVPSADKSSANKEEEKSETYSHNMTEAMGVVDIKAIGEYAKTHDVQHLRAEIRDFDAFDLRMQLPAVVSKLYKAVNSNGGVTYIHCTAGLGRAPAVATAYMFWVLGYTFKEAHTLLQSKRECFPKLDAIKSATADILTGLSKKPVTLSWEDSNCSRVEISGLDIGWGQRVPLNFDDKSGLWYLERELPEGRYEYKYIVDGEWTCNKDELVTSPNKDGHVNNFIQVRDNSSSDRVSLRERFSSDDPDLTTEERVRIKEFLEACSDEDL